MASRTKKAEQGNSGAKRRADDSSGALDISVFARQLLGDAAQVMSEDDLAVLQGQVNSFSNVGPPPNHLPPDPTAPTIVRDRKHLKQIVPLLMDASEVAIDLETSSLSPFDGEIVGVGLSAGAANYYVPTGHRFMQSNALRPDQLPIDVIARELRFDQLPLVAHNAKFEFRWIRRHAAITCNFMWDTMIAARLLASHLPADLKEIALRELDVPDWSLPKDEIEAVQFMTIERAARYCAKDCRYTLELFRRQHACIS